MKTKNVKLIIKDHVYVFEVPKDTAIYWPDILSKGKMLARKVGMQPATDAFGEIIGLKMKSWNGLKKIFLAEDFPGGFLTALAECVERTKRKIEAEKKCPGEKLPKLALYKHHGKDIKLNLENENSPFYYVDSIAYCDNCKDPHHPIKGIQKLTINQHGKVAEESPFSPTDSCCAHPNKPHKYVHVACRTIHIPVEIKQGEEIATSTTPSPPITSTLEVRKDTIEELMLKKIEDEDVPSDFIRGASWLYFEFKQREV